ncbi:hypothetical protein EGJ27_02815 [Pseudomonas sp. v388]|uniref:hypothetical protein n=1 Tax=Pseudomonas sp. v388 TaxID=2479849 RepID=UPI000F7A89D4|nr:hypothetical protein [Pseudomonas sp. v388]RRV10567.1 hypothetical protein EGJ27_02815 [Pseudomonas sp. v388]
METQALPFASASFSQELQLMDGIMMPGRKYRVRLQGAEAFVEGFFENNQFYEGVQPCLRVGFVDVRSNNFYRHNAGEAELDSKAELAGKVSGLTLIGIAGGIYTLLEMPSCQR